MIKPCTPLHVAYEVGAAFCSIQSATTGFTANIFPYRNRVSLKEAFEGLEPDEAKVSRPVLRGPGPSNGVWLLGVKADGRRS
jgi:hypothetical protein